MYVFFRDCPLYGEEGGERERERERERESLVGQIADLPLEYDHGIK